MIFPLLQVGPRSQTVVRADPGAAGPGLEGQDPDHQGDRGPGGRLHHLLDPLQRHVPLVVDREALEIKDQSNFPWGRGGGDNRDNRS